jgi:hypothetical protein
LTQRITTALALLCLSLVTFFALTACGGSGTTTVTVTTESEPTANASDTEAEPPAEEGETASEEEAATEEAAIEAELEELHTKTAETEAKAGTDEEAGTCEAMGINPEQLKEGKCEEEGQIRVVVNHATTLKLKTLNVKLLGIHKAKSIEGEFGESEQASGTFLTFDVELTNLTHSPAEWEQEQASLLLKGNTYSEDFDVQNGYETESLQWQLQSIQPQSSVTGTITFDVPDKIAKSLYSDGNLDFINFGENPFLEEEPEEIGIIRTYH